MSAERKQPSVLHAERDLAMGWLIRFAGSDDPDAYYAQHVWAYIDRLRGEIQKHNGPEGPLATAPRGERVSPFPHGRGLARLNLKHMVRVANCGISLGLSRLLAVLSKCVLPMGRRQAGKPFVVLLNGHLKPPTRGTVTTPSSHV